LLRAFPTQSAPVAVDPFSAEQPRDPHERIAIGVIMLSQMVADPSQIIRFGGLMQPAIGNANPAKLRV
jgi:hypothetical protein